MMQGDGKGIAMRPEHRKKAGKEDGTRTGIKKMAEIVAVADFTPAVREPEDIAAPPGGGLAPARRPGQVGLGVRTESIGDMIATAYIHVSGYIGKAAAALHSGDPVTAG